MSLINGFFVIMFVFKKIIVYFNINAAYADNNFNMPAHSEFVDFLIEGKGECKVIKNIKYENNTNSIKILQQ
ncbi:hypothetical protein ACOY72_11080 [Acinetobacter seifertii]|uniref:Uncharacterized protein n=1 Tax=Acinetobacter seifertii TaxID=1530123 RepID=N8SBD1_9GAMM|nr:hypothetical protein [Acinetobacter seifertii]ENU44928.1 hypothetical protein F985_00124 [Acinetobacter seifertii]